MTVDPHRFRLEIVAILPRLGRFALSLCRNRDDAEDLVQSAVVRALAHEAPKGEAMRLDSWMCAIVKNLWIDENRKRKIRGHTHPVDTTWDVAGEDGRLITESRSDLHYLTRALSRLSPELWSAGSLVILHGLSYREAAEVLGVPIGTVMSRVARTRKAALEGQAFDGAVRSRRKSAAVSKKASRMPGWAQASPELQLRGN